MRLLVSGAGQRDEFVYVRLALSATHVLVVESEQRHECIWFHDAFATNPPDGSLGDAATDADEHGSRYYVAIRRAIKVYVEMSFGCGKL